MLTLRFALQRYMAVLALAHVRHRLEKCQETLADPCMMDRREHTHTHTHTHYLILIFPGIFFCVCMRVCGVFPLTSPTSGVLPLLCGTPLWLCSAAPGCRWAAALRPHWSSQVSGLPVIGSERSPLPVSQSYGQDGALVRGPSFHTEGRLRHVLQSTTSADTYLTMSCAIR